MCSFLVEKYVVSFNFPLRFTKNKHHRIIRRFGRLRELHHDILTCESHDVDSQMFSRNYYNKEFLYIYIYTYTALSMFVNIPRSISYFIHNQNYYILYIGLSPFPVTVANEGL